MQVKTQRFHADARGRERYADGPGGPERKVKAFGVVSVVCRRSGRGSWVPRTTGPSDP
jgi:hypothetical protein